MNFKSRAAKLQKALHTANFIPKKDRQPIKNDEKAVARPRSSPSLSVGLKQRQDNGKLRPRIPHVHVLSLDKILLFQVLQSFPVFTYGVPELRLFVTVTQSFSTRMSILRGDSLVLTLCFKAFSASIWILVRVQSQEHPLPIPRRSLPARTSFCALQES